MAWLIGISAALFVLFVTGLCLSMRRRKCVCEFGFTPNPHDGDCAVCRGYEP